jgi:hypothetical protein
VEGKPKSTFISYSWDSEKHQQWVMYLHKRLRNKGIKASMDVFETQTSTVNLNAMMIKNMRDNDFVIIVLTENYAKKADNLQGGVGFETMLSLQALQKNPNKFIFITRHSGDFDKVFPYHLSGYIAIDFTNDDAFEDNFEKLLYRIQGVPYYEEEPLGEQPILKPKPIPFPQKREVKINDIDFSDIGIPNLKRITDKDKDEFITKSFYEIKDMFRKLFSSIKQANSNFDFTAEELNTTRTVFKLYVDGKVQTSVNMWIYNSFHTKSINLSYGNSFGIHNDGSYNESIHSEIDDNTKKLKLKMLMNMYDNKDADTPELIVKAIWKNNLAPHIR